MKDSFIWWNSGEVTPPVRAGYSNALNPTRYRPSCHGGACRRSLGVCTYTRRWRTYSAVRAGSHSRRSLAGTRRGICGGDRRTAASQMLGRSGAERCSRKAGTLTVSKSRRARFAYVSQVVREPTGPATGWSHAPAAPCHATLRGRLRHQACLGCSHQASTQTLAARLSRSDVLPPEDVSWRAARRSLSRCRETHGPPCR